MIIEVLNGLVVIINAANIYLLCRLGFKVKEITDELKYEMRNNTRDKVEAIKGKAIESIFKEREKDARIKTARTTKYNKSIINKKNKKS